MARILACGVLVGVAISLIANYFIGGTIYGLFGGSNVGTLAGTLAASIVGAILGAVAVHTSTRRDRAVVLRGTAAGAFIGTVGGFLGAIDTARLEGIGSNVVLLGIAVGAVAGAAGLRGTGGRYFSARTDNGERQGLLGRALDGALSGIIIGVLCALPVARFNSSIFIFFREIDPARRSSQDNRIEFVDVPSLDEMLIGAALGVVAGIIVGLVLSRKRMDGLLNGMLAGIAFGAVWALPHIIVMTFNEFLGAVLGSEVLWGGLALATLASAIFGAALPDFRIMTPWGLALIGGGIGVLFVLPYTIFAGAYILDGRVASSSRTLEQGLFQTFLAWNRGIPLQLLINVIAGSFVFLVVGAFMRQYAGIALGGLAVTVIAIAATLGLQANYFLLLAALYLLGLGIDLPSLFYLSREDLISVLWRTLINVSFGTLMGLIFAFTMKFAATRPIPDRIPPGLTNLSILYIL